MLTVTPTNRETTIPSHLFRVVLLRRLRLDHPLSVRCCPCGRPLDPCGHNRAACAGRDTWAAYALESIVARICREAGGRVLLKHDGQSGRTRPARTQAAVWRSSLMGCKPVVARRWQWTPHWSVLCTDMVSLVVEPHNAVSHFRSARRMQEITYPWWLWSIAGGRPVVTGMQGPICSMHWPLCEAS